VTAIAVAAVAVPQLQPGHDGGGTGAARPGLAHPAGFFTAAGPHGDLRIYSATTGRQTADVVPIEPHTALTAAADATGTSRAPIFILASTSTAGCGNTKLLMLTISAEGKPQSIASMKVPAITGKVTALASANDGRTIAYTSTICTRFPDSAVDAGVIGVMHTDGAPSRHWSWDPNPGQSVGSLSISADGKMIGFAVAPYKLTGPESDEVLLVREIRLLSTDAPPGPLNERSHVAVTIRTAAPGSVFTSAVLAASGRAMYFCTERGQFAHPGAGPPFHR
jgi:hypothetical protein